MRGDRRFKVMAMRIRRGFYTDFSDHYLARKARRIARQRGDIEDSKFEDVHACAEELMALLSGYSNPNYTKEYSYTGRVHTLLAKTSYFKEVFPSN